MDGWMDGWMDEPRKPQNRTLPKRSLKTYEFRSFGGVFCFFVWGATRRWPTIVKTERFGAPGPYIHTYKQPKQFTIQTFRHLKGRKTMYVKPYLHDIYHGFRTKHTYIHFKNGYFLRPPIPRNHGKYHAKIEKHPKNIKN